MAPRYGLRRELVSNGYRSGEVNIAVLPSRRRSDIPVVFAHGGGGFYHQWNDQGPAILPTMCAQAGLVGLCSDLGGQSPWGNPDHVDAVDDLVDWSAVHYGTRTDKVALVGLSHGAFTLNWAWRNPDRLAAELLIIPGVDMEGLYDRNPLGLVRAQMEAAYGSAAAVAAAYPTRDPSHPDNVVLQEPLVDRLAVWYGLDDTVAIPEEVETWVDLVGLPAGQAHGMVDVGHDFFFDWQPLADWLIPAVRHTA